MKEPPETLVWTDSTRVLAALAVVLLHTATPIVAGPVTLGSAAWWAGNLYDALGRWCVPAFVMVSGALLLAPHKGEPPGQFYRKRASRVLIPSLFWIPFFVLWTGWFKLRGQTPDWGALAMGVVSGVPYYHLWFLYMLVPLYLFVPFLRRVVQGSTRRELWLLTAAMFVLASIGHAHYELGPGSMPLVTSWFLYFLPYFLAGHLIAGARSLPGPWLSGGLFLLAVLATAVGCYALSRYAGGTAGFYFYGYLSVTLIPMSLAILVLLRRLDQPIINPGIGRKLAGLSLGVYLIHPIYIDLLQLAGLGPNAFTPALAVPLVALVSFLLSLASAWLIQRLPYLRRII